jgi:Fe-S-cluster-containing dehydrogenase component
MVKMVRYGMLIETDRCIGCDICLKACKDEFTGNDYSHYSAAQPEPSYGYGPDMTFGLPNTPLTVKPWVSHGHLWMKVKEETKGKYPDIKVRYVPMPCMHCDDPPCVKNSINGAVYKRQDGIVIIDPDKGINQRNLVESCPYDRIYLNTSKMIPQKCTFCAHLIDKSMLPRCVEACPLNVLTFGDLDDPNSELSKKVVALKAKPINQKYQTGPNVYYT